MTKAALGGGHFVHGDLFRNTVDCEPLREVTFLDLEAAKKRNTLQNSGIMAADRFHPGSRGAGPAAIYRALSEKKGRFIFIAIPTARNTITFAVGIAGEFIGAIDVPAKTDKAERQDGWSISATTERAFSSEPISLGDKVRRPFQRTPYLPTLDFNGNHRTVRR